MNLAAAYYAVDVQLDVVKNEIEALLTALFTGWQSWDFVKPCGISVYGAFDSARAVAQLQARGFHSVQLHDHRAKERIINCRCRVWECWPTE